MTSSRRTCRRAALALAVAGAAATVPAGEGTPPAARSAAGAADAAAPAVRTFDGVASSLLWVVRPQSKIKADLKNGTVFDLDAAGMGALAMADYAARLTTQPVGVTLPMQQPGGVIAAHYDTATKELRILLNGQSVLSAVKLELRAGPTRVCLRQRDQMGLYVIPPGGGEAALVWLDALDYRLVLIDGGQYELCSDVEAKMGGRAVPRAQLTEGIALDHLDEAANLVVRGRGPLGEPFEHRYAFDPAALEKKLDAGVDLLLKTIREKNPGGAGS